MSEAKGAEELAEELREERVRKKRLSLGKVVLAFLLFMLVLSGISFVLQHTGTVSLEELAPPAPGFYKGYIAGDKSAIFLFYEHPQYGLTPLQPGQTLHSNTLIIYWYAPFAGGNATRQLQVKAYAPVKVTVERQVGNETVIEERVENRLIDSFTATVVVSDSDFIENRVELPTDEEKTVYELWYGGEKIASFKHQTLLAYVAAPQMTYGQLFMQVSIYLIGGVLVCLAALGGARATINKVHYVPDLPRWALMIIPLIIAGAFGMGLYIIFFHLAVGNVAWLYAPIFLCFYLASVYMLREEPDIWIFMRDLEGERPAKEVVQLSVFEDAGEVTLVPETWPEFLKYLRGGRRRLHIQGEEYWWFDVPGEDIKVFYYNELHHLPSGDVSVKLAPIHYVEIDAYRSGVKGVEDVASAYHYTKHKLYEVLASLKRDSMEEGLRYAEEALSMIIKGEYGEVVKPKEEEGGEEGVVEEHP